VKTIRPAFWIAGVVILAAAFILVVHLSSNTMEFSRYNNGWNGTSSFFSDLDRHHTRDISDPDTLAGQPNNTILLIIAPYRDPTAQELAAYREFLDKGNTIFLADDYGTGNEILTGMGSRISILHGNLSSLDQQYPDPYTLVAYPSADESPISLPEDMVLDRAAPLEGGSPLVFTSVMSWNDINGDRRLNLGEEMGTFPVMANESIGPGQLIVLSDPSIFINSMYLPEENANNRYLIQNLTSRGGPVLIDQMNSRTAEAGGFSEIFHLARTTVIVEIFIICLLMLGTAWAWKRKMI
jgi:hypothetical protein